MKEKILVLSANSDTLKALSAEVSVIAEELGFAGVAAGSDSSVKNCFSKSSPSEYGMVIISAPLTDEYGLALADHIAENSDAAVIILASRKNAETAFSRIGKTGAAVLPKPADTMLLHLTMRFMNEQRRQKQALQKEFDELDRKLEEIKLIDRAKFALMQYLSISEDEAHKHLRTRAMNLRQTISQTAADILKTYEYLQ